MKVRLLLAVSTSSREGDYLDWSSLKVADWFPAVGRWVPASVAYIDKSDLIAAGSSVRGGTGTRAVEKEAKLILWDPKEEKKVFEIVPVPEV